MFVPVSEHRRVQLDAPPKSCNVGLLFDGGPKNIHQSPLGIQCVVAVHARLAFQRRQEVGCVLGFGVQLVAKLLYFVVHLQYDNGVAT